MTDDELNPPRPGDEIAADPLDVPPRLNRCQVEVERRLGTAGPRLAGELVEGWNQLLGGGMVADRFAAQWRAAGLRRPGVVAHLIWPRFRSRVALGIDPPLAHAVVDRLLGFERTAAESRLQISPVEWGILSFVIARGLERLDSRAGPLGPWDLAIDRVGPDPFEVAGLGAVVTWRWQVQVGPTTGVARLWLPESLLSAWLATAEDDAPSRALREFPEEIVQRAADLEGFGEATCEWRAEVGTITVDSVAGSHPLAPGRLFLIDESPLTGTAADPVGPVLLVQVDHAARRYYAAQIEPGSAGNRLILGAVISQNSAPRTPPLADFADPTAMASSNRSPKGELSLGESTEVAATLTVELGRVKLPLRQPANLRPGDVIELDREAGSPVDLVLNGRLIARGELVQVDTELGVRII